MVGVERVSQKGAAFRHSCRMVTAFGTEKRDLFVV
jgi:hypothetical protein